MNPLCPELFASLKKCFGSVLIANPGEELRATPMTDPFTGQEKLNISSSGEYYRVCCPMCGDTRHRLWINHRWAKYNWLLTCFNEGCYDDPLRRAHLHSCVLKTRRRVWALPLLSASSRENGPERGYGLANRFDGLSHGLGSQVQVQHQACP